jgi:hypothetical protein
VAARKKGSEVVHPCLFDGWSGAPGMHGQGEAACFIDDVVGEVYYMFCGEWVIAVIGEFSAIFDLLKEMLDGCGGCQQGAF